MTRLIFRCKSLNVILLSVPLLLINYLATGQTDSTSQQIIDTEIDSLPEPQDSYFYFDLSFTNNNINLKENTDQNIPATLLDVSFYHKTGIWAGVLPAIYHNTNQLSYDLDFNLGIQKFFANYFDVNLYYTYHNYVGDTATQGIDYTHALNLSLGCDISWFYLFGEGYANYGVSNNYYTDFGIAFYKDFDNIFTQNDYISIMPMVSTTFGTDYWFYDDYTERASTIMQTYLSRNGYNSNNFGYIGLDLILILNYQISNLGIGLSYNFNVPSNKYKLLDWENQSGFMISLNYLLNLK